LVVVGGKQGRIFAEARKLTVNSTANFLMPVNGTSVGPQPSFDEDEDEDDDDDSS
jgi:hypothetical protein